MLHLTRGDNQIFKPTTGVHFGDVPGHKVPKHQLLTVVDQRGSRFMLTVDINLQQSSFSKAREKVLRQLNLEINQTQ